MYKTSFFLALTLTLSAATLNPLDPAVSRALADIRPAELKGDLSFLASDALQGRYSPSPGLDIAAEFIASKFRSFGLQPVGKSDYFQFAEMVDRKLPKVITPLIARNGDTPITIEPARIFVASISAPLTLAHAQVIKLSEADPEKLPTNLSGKVVLIAAPRSSLRALIKALSQSGALAVVAAFTSTPRVPASRFLFAEDAFSAAPPVVLVESPELAEAIKSPAPLTLSLEIPAPTDTKATVKNVIGILRGSDPKLKSTCVLITAHYDHIGTTETAEGLTQSKPTGEDHIYNGANDDGSGTVSVIEIARALSQIHPRRSVVFMTFFGEERGLLGSTFYGRHPVFPISKTVADINLEQVGRTDSSEGPELANASLTGYDYSNVTTYLEEAGKRTGIKIYKDDAASDQYFVRSDNAALAEQGVPAHTLTTAFEYPDYHGLGDEWQKIDYDNMARVDRTVALAVLNIANATTPPEWNTANPKTKPFRDAQAKSSQTP